VSNRAGGKSNGISEFQPDFNGESTLIHPAIGVVGDVAYVGVRLPGKDRKNGDNVTVTTKRFCLITSAGHILPANGLRTKLGGLSCSPYPMASRWPLNDIKRFCDEKLLANSPLKSSEVLTHVIDSWKYYLELPDVAGYVYDALWDIGTYFHHLFNSYPYDYKGGIKRSGKTKALTISSCIAFNAVLSSDVTVSAMFRLTHQTKATLLMDETERLANPHESEEYRNIILAGYKHGGVVFRSEKVEDNWVPTAFDVYSPKRLANISGLDSVLEDRVIQTYMMRPTDRKIANREVNPNDTRWADLRCELYRLYLTYWKEVKGCYEKLNELSREDHLIDLLKNQTAGAVEEADLRFLTARQLELWKPILALALFFDSSNPGGTPILPTMIEMAVDRSLQNQTDNTVESPEVILVQAMLRMVKDESWSDGYVPVTVIKDAMKAEYNEEAKWLNEMWVGRMLGRFGFGRGLTGKRRVGGGIHYMLIRKAVEAFAQRLGVQVGEEQGSSTILTHGGSQVTLEDDGFVSAWLRMPGVPPVKLRWKRPDRSPEAT
jgi:hypothetical protein